MSKKKPQTKIIKFKKRNYTLNFLKFYEFYAGCELLHEKIRTIIGANPQLIGLKNIICSEKEFPLRNKKVDLHLIDSTKMHYLIEIKSGEFHDEYLLEKYASTGLDYDEKLEEFREQTKQYKDIYNKQYKKPCRTFLVYRKDWKIFREEI